MSAITPDQVREIARPFLCSLNLEGKRVLWIDDRVTNNRKEHELLEGLGLKVEQVQSNAAAEQALGKDGGGYDLILSDIAPHREVAGEARAAEVSRGEVIA